MDVTLIVNIDVGTYRVMRNTAIKYTESTLAKNISRKDIDNMIIFNHVFFFDRNSG